MMCFDSGTESFWGFGSYFVSKHSPHTVMILFLNQNMKCFDCCGLWPMAGAFCAPRKLCHTDLQIYDLQTAAIKPQLD